jgi:hypothetical protein
MLELLIPLTSGTCVAQSAAQLLKKSVLQMGLQADDPTTAMTCLVSCTFLLALSAAAPD